MRELLVHGFEEWGPEFFAGLHGSFVAALWDAPNRRLMLVNDRFGSKPLYFTLVPGSLLFASEIKALLFEPGVSRQLSLRGFAQFFTFGQFLGDETLWEKIRLVPAAGCLTYDAPTKRLTESTYWRPKHSASGTRLLRHATSWSGITTMPSKRRWIGECAERSTWGYLFQGVWMPAPFLGSWIPNRPCKRSPWALRGASIIALPRN